MQIPESTYCPLIQGECRKLECSWFVKLRGTDKNTGKEVDEWFCAVTTLPMLLIENSQQQRETGAAVESFRNEMVKSNDASKGLILASLMRGGPQMRELPRADGGTDIKMVHSDIRE